MGGEQHNYPPSDAATRGGLYRDGWFWLAFALGPAISWALFLLIGNTAISGFTWAQWQPLLWFILLYPIIEEWLFRGILQRQLLKNYHTHRSILGFTLANGITSLLFAAAHLLNHSPHWALLVILPSLLFGWFRDRYGSIFPGVILHCSYNFSYFFLFPPSGN